MSEAVNIDCPACEAVKTIAILGTVGSNVSQGWKVFKTGVALTEYTQCGYMIRTEEELSQQLHKLIPETKHIGIIVDNYKLSKYKFELIKAGFADIKEAALTKSTTAISVIVKADEFAIVKDKITLLCKQMEHYFKNRN